VVWGEHEGRLRTAVLALKHAGRDELARPLGQRLAGLVARQPWLEDLDVVTAIPSHPYHRVRRGWVAAELVARVTAGELGRPFARLMRRRGLTRQAGRDRAERLRLPSHRLSARSELPGSTVLVVDDVVTTGSTFRAAARALTGAGARGVYCAAVSRTPSRGGR